MALLASSGGSAVCSDGIFDSIVLSASLRALTIQFKKTIASEIRVAISKRQLIEQFAGVKRRRKNEE
ncbi:hypothetical protein L484_026140 [Morus notabilis]|uniref:Uncharacterized protein n=1 Tax=Morus notabilis TaxID=981085 RepID=W9R873_9ROSA|nr:hypothetical protein L484_026140 [Morus notabilis]